MNIKKKIWKVVSRPQGLSASQLSFPSDGTESRTIIQEEHICFTAVQMLKCIILNCGNRPLIVWGVWQTVGDQQCLELIYASTSFSKHFMAIDCNITGLKSMRVHVSDFSGTCMITEDLNKRGTPSCIRD